MRRLWKGEVIFGHDGPAGKFPVLHLDASFDEDIPLGFVAFGPNSLALAGRCFDAVVLHTFFTDETVERCVATVRSAAEAAGPRSGVGAHLVVLRDDRRPPPRAAAAEEDGRPARDLPPGLRRPARRDQRLGSRGAGALSRRRGRVVVPGRARRQGRHRRRSSTSRRCCPTSGSSPRRPATRQRCAARVLRQFDLGVDGVIMHGATPTELAPVVDAYRAIRPAGRFDGWPPNPGRTPRNRVRSAHALHNFVLAGRPERRGASVDDREHPARRGCAPRPTAPRWSPACPTRPTGGAGPTPSCSPTPSAWRRRCSPASSRASTWPCGRRTSRSGCCSSTARRSPGLVLVTVNPAYRPSELEYVLRQSRAVGIFLLPEFRDEPDGGSARVRARRAPRPARCTCSSPSGTRSSSRAARADAASRREAGGRRGAARTRRARPDFPKGALLHAPWA